MIAAFRLAVIAMALTAVASFASTPAPATATATASYTHAAGSSLGFSSSYDGEAFNGRFTQFTTNITFDPATATGRFDVAIALASAGTDNDERDETLRGSDFFNAAAMPQARYAATRFRKLADGRFVAEGTLTLRGITHAVPLTFRWTPGTSPVLDGVATVNRLKFGVGAGDWDDIEVLPDAVTVRTRLVLQPPL